MKKISILILTLLAAVTLKAQDSKLASELTLSSQHMHRGVAFTVAPVFEGGVNYKFTDWLTLGTEATIGLNNVPVIGNTLNTYVRMTRKNFTLDIKDYYFFNGYSAAGNDYFDLGENTNHFVEASLKYSTEDAYGLVAYVIHQNANLENPAVYFEAGYNLMENLKVSCGYVTDASALNFRTDAGITHLGLSTWRDLKISSSWTTKITTGLYYNPSFKNVVDVTGISATPATAVVSLTF